MGNTKLRRILKLFEKKDEYDKENIKKQTKHSKKGKVKTYGIKIK